MTPVETTFVYHSDPGLRQLTALCCIRDIYGIRQIHLDETEHSVRVEYDASRLSNDDVASLLFTAGIDLCGRLWADA